MSTASARLDYSEPRAIWALSLQFLYTILAMLPFYYYMSTLLELPPEARYLMQYLPIGVAVLLFFMEIYLNKYFWRREKIIKDRDPFLVGLKSIIVVLGMFYIIYFGMFGYWFDDLNAYEEVGLNNVIGQLMGGLITTLVIILLTVIMMNSIQNARLQGRSLTDRLRRR